MNINLILNKSGLYGNEYDKFSELFTSGTFHNNNKDYLLKCYYTAIELLDIFGIYYEASRPIDLLIALGYFDDIMTDTIIPPVKHIDRDIVAHVSKSNTSQTHKQLLDAITDQVFTRGFDRQQFIKYFDIYLAGIRHTNEKKERKQNMTDATDEMKSLAR